MTPCKWAALTPSQVRANNRRRLPIADSIAGLGCATPANRNSEIRNRKLARDVLVEWDAANVVHDQKNVVLVLPTVVHRHDVRVLEPAEDFDLAAEAGQSGRAPPRQWPAVHKLDRDVPARRFLNGEIDDALAAAVQLTQPRVTGQRRARQPGRWSGEASGRNEVPLPEGRSLDLCPGRADVGQSRVEGSRIPA